MNKDMEHEMEIAELAIPFLHPKIHTTRKGAQKTAHDAHSHVAAAPVATTAPRAGPHYQVLLIPMSKLSFGPYALTLTQVRV